MSFKKYLFHCKIISNLITKLHIWLGTLFTKVTLDVNNTMYQHQGIYRMTEKQVRRDNTNILWSSHTYILNWNLGYKDSEIQTARF